MRDACRTVLFVLLNQYADWEAAYLSSALNLLGQERFCVRTVSLTKEPVSSIGGFRALPDYAIGDIPDYEGLMLIGGLSWRSEEARRGIPLVHDARTRGKVIGGICDAAGFLGTAGALNDVRHTANDLSELKARAGDAYRGEALFLPRQAVRDQRVVTANGTAPLEFAREALLALDTAPESEIMGWYNFYKLGFYTASMG